MISSAVFNYAKLAVQMQSMVKALVSVVLARKADTSGKVRATTLIQIQRFCPVLEAHLPTEEILSEFENLIPLLHDEKANVRKEAMVLIQTMIKSLEKLLGLETLDDSQISLVIQMQQKKTQIKQQYAQFQALNPQAGEEEFKETETFKRICGEGKTLKDKLNSSLAADYVKTKSRETSEFFASLGKIQEKLS